MITYFSFRDGSSRINMCLFLLYYIMWLVAHNFLWIFACILVKVTFFSICLNLHHVEKQDGGGQGDWSPDLILKSDWLKNHTTTAAQCSAGTACSASYMKISNLLAAPMQCCAACSTCVCKILSLCSAYAVHSAACSACGGKYPVFLQCMNSACAACSASVWKMQRLSSAICFTEHQCAAWSASAAPLQCALMERCMMHCLQRCADFR